MAIAGHVSQKMLAHYSHVRVEAKRKALDALAGSAKNAETTTQIQPRRLFLLWKSLRRMAGTTGLEPAASAVTGQRSNQLNYVPTLWCQAVTAPSRWFAWVLEPLAHHPTSASSAATVEPLSLPVCLTVDL